MVMKVQIVEPSNAWFWIILVIAAIWLVGQFLRVLILAALGIGAFIAAIYLVVITFKIIRHLRRRRMPAEEPKQLES
jgi:type VI protein secretion system component VasK